MREYKQVEKYEAIALYFFISKCYHSQGPTKVLFKIIDNVLISV